LDWIDDTNVIIFSLRKLRVFRLITEATQEVSTADFI